ncbi:MAG: GAF domain-containing sensor histidine kinase, partial [Anaerolineales bacterium]|nr:GAF domain-containing sensor histidine kinase [Anaerolineales bacterium]
MTATEIVSILPLLAAVAYTLVLIAPSLRRSRQELALKWFLAFLGASVIWEFLLFFVPYSNLPPNLPITALLVGTTFLGMTTAVYVRWPRQKSWLLLAGLAILAASLVDLFVPNQPFQLLAASSWATITVSSVISFVTWFALSFIILLRTWRDYRRTDFPWHANRLLFWVLTLLLVFSGEALMFVHLTGLTVAGQIIRYLGVLGLAYAVVSHRIFDVRTRIRRGIAYFIIVLISALPLAALIVLVQRITQNQLRTTLIVTSITVVVSFVIYQPLRSLVERITYRYLFGEGFNPNQVVRDYSKAISRTLDVQQLSLLILGILSDKFETNRGALMLVTAEGGEVEIEPVPGMGSIPRYNFRLPANNLFVATLIRQHQPLLQYELDFNPAFTEMRATAVSWLKDMAMEAYVPVSAGDGLDGVIAVGPKRSGVPYQPGELDLMQVLADQTVVALQNARLYSELEEQNKQINNLNVDLVQQNERLEIMDQVKSDFITIASHELRTPLTQVKGYADILAAMNDSNSLTQEQTKEIVGHINRATIRLESLISAMLDASQIDVEGMQLTYMDTRLETIIRLAMEPLNHALRERRISFSSAGLAELPTIQADFKRLVQAFTNILGNAVKYTPDHGSIFVEGFTIPSENGDNDYIEIVVADTGIGIDARYHELIFEKFFRIGDPQLHSTGSTKYKGAGPGLGLPIARGVIEAHDGRIWV